MNPNVMAARILLQDAEFDLAKELLEQEKKDTQALYYLSLLHRYYDEYNDELNLVVQALTFDPTNVYMKSRLNWYASSLQKDLKPRQTLHLPAHPHKIPSKDILAQLCFVTSGHNHPTYFNLLVQQIESIKATQHYTHVPLCILDGGLTDEQKQTLTTTFKNITIKDPLWDLAMPEGMELYQKTGMAQAFMDQHFPGYRFYMWLANDTWVQDENSIHDFLYQAQLRGAGLVLKDNEKSWKRMWPDINAEYKFYPKSFDDFLLGRHNYASGAFCIDAKTNFFNLWRKALIEIHKESGYELCLERVAFNFAAHKLHPINPLVPLDHTHCFTRYSEGFPVLEDPSNGVLHLPSTLQPLGIIYFEDELFIANYPIVPMAVTKTPLSQKQCYWNHTFSSRVVEKSQSENFRPDVFESTCTKTVLASYHYRAWSEDKSKILELLQAPIQFDESRLIFAESTGE